jgi:Mn-dependent DtxR family transcriptional regulator
MVFMKLTHSQMRYLLAIHRISENGKGVRSSDIVEFLGFARPSVSRMLRILSEMSLVEKDRFGKISFTQDGRDVLNAVWKKAEVLSFQLQDVLELTEEAAEDCALLLLAQLPEYFEFLNTTGRKQVTQA